MRTFEKIVCVEGFQNTILACLLDRFNNLMPDLDTFCHLVWNKIHNHWGLTTKTRVHRGRTAHSIDHVSRILPLTSLKECFYYFAKWLTGKETLFFNTSYNRTKISYFFSVFSVRKRPLSSPSAGEEAPRAKVAKSTTSVSKKSFKHFVFKAPSYLISIKNKTRKVKYSSLSLPVEFCVVIIFSLLAVLLFRRKPA